MAALTREQIAAAVLVWAAEREQARLALAVTPPPPPNPYTFVQRPVRGYQRQRGGKIEQVRAYRERGKKAEPGVPVAPPGHGFIPFPDWEKGQKIWEARGEKIWSENEWKRRGFLSHFAADLDTIRAADVDTGHRVMLPHPRTGQLRPAWVRSADRDGDSIRLEVEHRHMSRPGGPSPEYAGGMDAGDVRPGDEVFTHDMWVLVTSRPESAVGAGPPGQDRPRDTFGRQGFVRFQAIRPDTKQEGWLLYGPEAKLRVRLRPKHKMTDTGKPGWGYVTNSPQGYEHNLESLEDYHRTAVLRLEQMYGAMPAKPRGANRAISDAIADLRGEVAADQFAPGRADWYSIGRKLTTLEEAWGTRTGPQTSNLVDLRDQLEALADSQGQWRAMRPAELPPAEPEMITERSTHVMDQAATLHAVPQGVPDEELVSFPDEVDIEPLIPEPAPLKVARFPEGHPVARPVLYTYQRKKLVALELDAGGQDIIVAQAAARIRARLPLDSQQARALADYLIKRANELGVGKVQQRTLLRIAYRMTAAADEIMGTSTPITRLYGKWEVTPALVRDLTEGDTFAWRGPSSSGNFGKIVGLKQVMRGRVVEIDLEHDDGTRERHVFSGKTQAYLLPDRKPDKPLPPPAHPSGGREFVTVDRLRVNDVVEVSEPGSDFGSSGRITKIRTIDASNAELTLKQLAGTGTVKVARTSYDGGPVWVRTVRGSGSANQPWDSLLPEEHPEPVSWDQVRVGDRVRILQPGYGVSQGVVEGVRRVTGEEGVPGAEYTIRIDAGVTDTVQVYATGENKSITRLSRGGEDAAAAVRKAQLAREKSAAQAQIYEQLKSVVQSALRQDLYRVGWSDSDSPEGVIQRIQSRTSAETLRNVSYKDRLGSAVVGRGWSVEGMREATNRLEPLLIQLIDQGRQQVIDSLRSAEPHPGEEQVRAWDRVLEQFRKNPPLPSPQVAATLAELRVQLAEIGEKATGRAAEPPMVPQRPERPGGLRARMQVFRRLLPADQSNIGRTYVEREMFRAPNLAQLEQGIVPEIKPTPVWVDDQAEDGGPGEMSMRQNDVIRAAGRELEDEIGRRIEARLAELDVPANFIKAQAAYTEFTRQRNGLFDQMNDARDAARDAVARGHGYASYEKLVDAMYEAQDALLVGPNHPDAPTDPAERAKLREKADQLHAWMYEGVNAGTAAREELQAEYARMGKKDKQLEAELNRWGDMGETVEREEIIKALEEARGEQFGGYQLTYRKMARGYGAAGGVMGERSVLVKGMRLAESSYPQSWLKHADEHAPNGYQLGSQARGDYNDAVRRIRLSKDYKEQIPGFGYHHRVATHELGHAMERAVPGLLASEHAELWRRTSTGEVGSRVREASQLMAGYVGEYSRRDEFPEQYSGKDYIGTGWRPSAFELFTTGVESLLAGSKYLDSDFKHWMLGTMALLGGGDGGTAPPEAGGGEVMGEALPAEPDDTSYRFATRPLRDGPPLHDLTQMYPDDMYTHPEWYSGGTPLSRAERESFLTAVAVRGKPDQLVTIYRAVPPEAGDKILPGDWVAISKAYADQHADMRWSEQGEAPGRTWKVISKRVPAKDVREAGNATYTEWGYWPEEAQGDVGAPLPGEESSAARADEVWVSVGSHRARGSLKRVVPALASEPGYGVWPEGDWPRGEYYKIPRDQAETARKIKGIRVLRGEPQGGRVFRRLSGRDLGGPEPGNWPVPGEEPQQEPQPFRDERARLEKVKVYGETDQQAKAKLLELGAPGKRLWLLPEDQTKPGIGFPATSLGVTQSTTEAVFGAPGGIAGWAVSWRDDAGNEGTSIPLRVNSLEDARRAWWITDAQGRLIAGGPPIFSEDRAREIAARFGGTASRGIPEEAVPSMQAGMDEERGHTAISRAFREATDDEIKQQFNIASAHWDAGERDAAASAVREAARLARAKGLPQAHDYQVLAARLEGAEEPTGEGGLDRLWTDLVNEQRFAEELAEGGDRGMSSWWNVAQNISHAADSVRRGTHDGFMMAARWMDNAADLTGQISGYDPMEARYRDFAHRLRQITEDIAQTGTPRQASEEFARKVAETVPALLGGGKQAFSGNVQLFDENDMPGTLAQLTWAGDISLREDLARQLQQMIADPTAVMPNPDALNVILHELVHGVIGVKERYSAHRAAYQEHVNAQIEEGFTQAASALHLADWLKQVGLADVPTPMVTGSGPEYRQAMAALVSVLSDEMTTLDRYQVGQGTGVGGFNAQRISSMISAALFQVDRGNLVGVRNIVREMHDMAWDDEAESIARAADALAAAGRTMTLGDYAAQVGDPAVLSDGMSDHYATYTKKAWEFAKALAGPDRNRELITKLIDEIARVGTRDKASVMADQVIRHILRRPDAPIATVIPDAGLEYDVREAIHDAWDSNYVGSEVYRAAVAEARDPKHRAVLVPELVFGPPEGKEQTAVKRSTSMERTASVTGGETYQVAHNTERAPDMGTQFGQDVEPAGRYLVQREPGDNYDYPGSKWETGAVSFENALHVPYGDIGSQPGNWKRVLSAQYGGKRGRALSRALLRAGYDGIVTHDENGSTREIVDLRGIGARTAVKVPSVTEDEGPPPGARQISYDDADRLVEQWFHPQQLEATRVPHPRSGFMVESGIGRQVSRPAEGTEGPPTFDVRDYGDPNLPSYNSLKFMGGNSLGTEPIQHVYRGVSEDEWDQAQGRGYLQSDQRGTLADWEGTNAAVDPRDAISYLPTRGRSVILKIAVRPEDKWFTIRADSYIRTRNQVPVDRVEAVSPPMARYGKYDLLSLLPVEGEQPATGWEGFPFDARKGEAPRVGDTPPERTPEGDFVFYHGTSSSGAASIMAENRIAPDGLGVVGLATTPQGAADYAAMKGAGPRLRVTVSRDMLSRFVASHEIGGSGHDQFLIQRPHGAPPGVWTGLALKSAKIVTPGRPSVQLKTKLSSQQRQAQAQYTSPGGTRAINDPLRAGTPLTVNAVVNDYQTVRHLDAAIAKSAVDAPGTVYRGVGRRPGDVPWVPGDVIGPDPGYTSASGDPVMAEQFAILRATGGEPGTGLLGVKYDPNMQATGGAPVTLAIHLAEGQHALEGDPSVDEFVLPRGVSLTVTGVRTVTLPDWQRQPYAGEQLPPPGTHQAQLVDAEVTETNPPPPVPTATQALATPRAARRAERGTGIPMPAPLAVRSR